LGTVEIGGFRWKDERNRLLKYRGYFSQLTPPVFKEANLKIVYGKST